MPLKFYTAQYRYKGEDRMDITVKGQDPIGKMFAPTWAMVMGLKDGKLSCGNPLVTFFQLYTQTTALITRYNALIFMLTMT